MSNLLPDSWSALYQAQLSRYQVILESDQNIDTKGGVVLGAILAIAIFALDKQLFLIDNRFLFALLVIGCFAYLAALGMLIFVLTPKLYTLPANTTKDHPEYLTKNDENLMYQLIVDVEFAADQIEENLKNKTLLFSLATVLFIAGTLALVVVKLMG